MADPIFIHIRELDLRNNKKSILRINHATIPVEKITCIVGENGSGKTSLLNAIAGLDKSAKACIDLPKLSTCMVHNQSTVLKMSVKENLTLLKDVDKTITPDFVDQVLMKFQLMQFSKSPATLLSTGETQRLALARAYLLDAQLILLDEPTSSLDTNSRDLIESFIVEMTKEGTRFLIVSHDMNQVQRLSEHVVFLEKNELRLITSTHQHFNDAGKTES
jgi:tungstate transport system ATP-binding protein